MQIAFFITDVVLSTYSYYTYSPHKPNPTAETRNTLQLATTDTPVTVCPAPARKPLLTLRHLEAHSRLIKNALSPELKEMFHHKVDALLETINKCNASRDVKSEVSRVLADKCSYLNRCYLNNHNAPKNIREEEFLLGVNVLDKLVISLFNIETHIENIKIQTAELVKQNPLSENEVNYFFVLMEEHLQKIKNKIVDCTIKNGPKALDDCALIYANRYKSWFESCQNQNNRPNSH